jgi:two-component system, sensor histidine kinase PdtaS
LASYYWPSPLERPKPQEVLLTVADDGVGLPAALDPGHTGSLGLKLVFLLTGQLHGTVTFERASGTAVQIRFPNPSDTTP